MTDEGGDIHGSGRTEVQDKIEETLDNDGVISDIWGSIKGKVENLVWGIVRSLFTAYKVIPAAIVGLIAFLFLGGDRALKEQVKGFPGLADIPILLETWIIGAIEPVASSILASIAGINTSLVLMITGGTSIFTAPLLVLLQALELGLLFYALWAGVQLAKSAPIVGGPLAAIGRIVTRPFRAVAEVIR